MKRIILYIIVLLPVLGSAQFEEQISIKDAVTASYDIRTAGVKIVKYYIYNNMGITFSFKEMDNSFSKSEDAILLLEQYTQDKPKAKKTLETIKALRKKGRMMFLHKPKKGQMAKAKKMLEKLLKLNNKLIKEINATSGKKVSEEFELSRKIEVTIQQFTILYALQSKGDQSPDTSKKIGILSKGIDNMINKLMGSKNNTNDTTYYLQLLKSDFDMYKKTLNSNSGASFLNTLYVLSSKIGNTSHKLSKMFQ